MLRSLQRSELRLKVLNMPLFPLPEGSLTTTRNTKSAHAYAKDQGHGETAEDSHLTFPGTEDSGCVCCWGSAVAVVLTQHDSEPCASTERVLGHLPLLNSTPGEQLQDPEWVPAWCSGVSHRPVRA